jgi:cobalt-zinc-cadmium efflux system outer membrane protein
MAGPRRLEGADEQALVFGLSAPLPLFDRNQGAIGEASALAAKAGAARQATEVRLRALLYRLWQQLAHAGHVLDVLERDVLPASEETLALSREGFERGAFSHLELLDAERAFLEARSRRIEAAAAFHGFVLEVERVTGSPIDGGEAVRPGSDQGGRP